VQHVQAFLHDIVGFLGVQLDGQQPQQLGERRSEHLLWPGIEVEVEDGRVATVPARSIQVEHVEVAVPVRKHR
jgi:hypothetical protein